MLAAASAGAVPEAPVIAFDRFVRTSDPVCRRDPAPVCVDLAWRFADADGDDGLSIDELRALRADLEVWAIWRQTELAAQERSGIAMGLWLLDVVGLDYLHAAYDADGDGWISRAELLADVRLDQRPLSAILLDPDAVDRSAIVRRLGLPPAILDQIPLEP
jgi:hypothetical protein